jgi:hypothetical protein
MDSESAGFLDAGDGTSRFMNVRPLFVCTPKGARAADEMLRIANNLQRG